MLHVMERNARARHAGRYTEVDMNKVMIAAGALLAASLVMATACRAAEPVDEGRQLLQSNCLSCHDAGLDPPMGPPMFAVQMRYKRATAGRDDFIDRLTAFTMHPSGDKAAMRYAVEQLGVMPDIGAEEADVRRIAAYIYDATFAPPCAHWAASMKRANAAGDVRHYKRDQAMFNRMCK